MAVTTRLVSSTPPESSIPIPERTRPTAYLQSICFGLLFNAALFMINGTQFLLLPFYPLPATRPIYERGQTYCKHAFARTLMLISQLFGPTTVILSWEDHDGKLIDPEQFVTRDPSLGNVTHIELPSKSVWMSNHQVYTDWLYLWCIAYYAGLADCMLIILKDSLKWIPIVGWGMQFYRFIFLARNWMSDKVSLAHHLRFMSSRTRPTSLIVDPKTHHPAPPKRDPKVLLLIFPEGTLISENTQPVSKKFAEKNGWENPVNVLLPRSTGLQFCLRALRANVPDLKLVDFTIGYPGVPPGGYGQRYYTLRSIFMQGVSPPAVHVLCTVSEVPALSSPPPSSASTSINSPPPLGAAPTSSSSTDDEASEGDKKRFDEWLRGRWTHKDRRMQEFYDRGDFVGGAYAESAQAAGGYRRHPPTSPQGATIGTGSGSWEKRYVEIPLRLRSPLEAGDAFCWFAPLLAAWVLKRIVQALW